MQIKILVPLDGSYDVRNPITDLTHVLRGHSNEFGGTLFRRHIHCHVWYPALPNGLGHQIATRHLMETNVLSTMAGAIVL